MKISFRRSLAFVHRWTGLTVGIIILMLALTGSVLSMRPQLDRILYKDIKTSSSCTTLAPLDTLTAAALKVHRSDIAYLRVDPGSGDSAMVRFRDNESVFVDPCTGVALGSQNRYGGIFGIAEQMHKLAYQAGGLATTKINGVTLNLLTTGSAALIFAVVLLIGGFFLWWPRRRNAWKAAVRLNPKLTGRAFALNLHTTIGIYTGLIVLVSAVTGAVETFDWPKTVLHVLTGSKMVEHEYKSKVPEGGGKRVTTEDIWQRTQKLVPPVGTSLLFQPKKPDDAIMVYTVDRDAPQSEARNFLYFDAYSGDLLNYQPYSQMSRGMQLYFWGLSIHTGRFGGLLVDLILLTGALGVPVLAYSGTESYLRKKFRKPVPLSPQLTAIKVRVAKIKEEALFIKSFELVSESGAPLPAFTPGSHVNVKIEEGLVRQYSLCNGPNETGSYTIAIKRDPNSRGGSQAMHDKVQQGDVLTINAPRCNFPLVPNASHYLLIAAGIGITPILSMARHLQATGASWSMQYFTRSVEMTAFHEVLLQSEFAEKVAFHYTAEPDRLRTYLHQLLRLREGNAHIFMCGPRPFMELVEAAAEPTWPPESIHIEHFSADPMALAGPQDAFEIKLAHSKKTFVVPAGVSISQVLTSNGIGVMTSCEQGVCGTCLTGVLEGIPDHRDSFLSPAEHKACQKIMVCVSRAKSERLVLDI